MPVFVEIGRKSVGSCDNQCVTTRAQAEVLRSGVEQDAIADLRNADQLGIGERATVVAVRVDDEFDYLGRPRRVGDRDDMPSAPSDHSATLPTGVNVPGVAQRKTERLLNLVILLLNTRRPVTAAQIRDIVPGYPDGGEAFGRMFERDKAELRELGIPVAVEGLSNWDDEVGYLIRPGDYALPDIDLEPDEAAALALAARVWQQASLAEAASGAMLKLRAAGVDMSDVSLTGVEAHVTATEPAFEPLWQAVCDRRAVTFGYQGSGATVPTERHVEPWGVVSWHGRWYLAGQDRDRGESRVFRLDRVKGEVTSNGQSGEFVVPDNVDLRHMVAGTATQEPRRTARIRVRSGAGLGLRRRASSSTSADADQDVIDVDFVGADALADEIAGYGADAVVVEPDDVREIVVDRLRAAAGRA